jgi:hypothetical protein
MSTLAEFAAEKGGRPNRKCFTCKLPQDVLSQVEDARAQAEPVTFPVIAEWLNTEGHDVSAFNLRNHFAAKHQDDPR